MDKIAPNTPFKVRLLVIVFLPLVLTVNVPDEAPDSVVFDKFIES